MRGTARKSERNLVIICHNIRSAWNVGSIFRTSDAAGVTMIFLSGYTPDPTHPGVSKTALGAEKSVRWRRIANLNTLWEKLRNEGYQLVALEQDEQSSSLRTFKPEKNIALIVGNEVRGLSRAILKKCDKIIEIPMRGRKESLNVSVAFGIAVYKILS